MIPGINVRLSADFSDLDETGHKVEQMAIAGLNMSQQNSFLTTAAEVEGYMQEINLKLGGNMEALSKANSSVFSAL